MKHEKTETINEIVELNPQGSGPSLEELQQSYQLLETLMAVLPPGSKEELIDLLQTLAQSNESQGVISSVHQRALAIVSDICQPNPSQEVASPSCAQEMEERRQRERRQK